MVNNFFFSWKHCDLNYNSQLNVYATFGVYFFRNMLEIKEPHLVKIYTDGLFSTCSYYLMCGIIVCAQ